MTKEQILEVYLADGSVSLTSASKKLGVSRSTLRRLLHKYNIYAQRASWVCGKCNQEGQEFFKLISDKYCKDCATGVKSSRDRDLWESTKKHLVNFLGGKCTNCKYDKCIASLDFHHTIEANKPSDWSNKRRWSWERLLQEISDCEILCKNCHTELHYLENKHL